MPGIKKLKRHHRVEFVDDERKIGNGVLITLRKGWTFEAGADNRVRGYKTFTDAIKGADESLPHPGPFDP